MRCVGGIGRASGLVLFVAAMVTLSGCGEDTVRVPIAAPVPTPAPVGPLVTFFGLTRADDTLIEPSGTTPDGIPVFARTAGSGFRIVVEAKPGSNGSPVGLSSYEEDGSDFPDLQILVSRPLGDGSQAVCDIARVPGPEPTPAGGVPAIDPPSFAATQTHIDTVNDLACRFRDGSGTPTAITSPIDGCVKFLPTEDYGFVDSSTTAQFCGFVTGAMTFPAGDTTVTVRVRDIDGNPGAVAQIVIHVEA